MAIPKTKTVPPVENLTSEFKKVVETAEYTKEYKEQCFAAWYAADCPRSRKLAIVLPKDELGSIPNDSTIRKWMRGWRERAKKLDIQTTESLDALLIKKRVEMFERHAETGAEMVEMGMEYLDDKGIKSDASAIRSIKEGTDLERTSLGGSELWKSITTMSDSQLQKLAADLPAEDENILDAEFEENKAGEDE